MAAAAGHAVEVNAPRRALHALAPPDRAVGIFAEVPLVGHLYGRAPDVQVLPSALSQRAAERGGAHLAVQQNHVPVHRFQHARLENGVGHERAHPVCRVGDAEDLFEILVCQHVHAGRLAGAQAVGYAVDGFARVELFHSLARSHLMVLSLQAGGTDSRQPVWCHIAYVAFGYSDGVSSASSTASAGVTACSPAGSPSAVNSMAL